MDSAWRTPYAPTRSAFETYLFKAFTLDKGSTVAVLVGVCIAYSGDTSATTASAAASAMAATTTGHPGGDVDLSQMDSQPMQVLGEEQRWVQRLGTGSVLERMDRVRSPQAAVLTGEGAAGAMSG